MKREDNRLENIQATSENLEIDRDRSEEILSVTIKTPENRWQSIGGTNHSVKH